MEDATDAPGDGGDPLAEAGVTKLDQDDDSGECVEQYEVEEAIAGLPLVQLLGSRRAGHNGFDFQMM